MSHCLCAYVEVIENRTHVLVLQHPDEARHPLNTARLAVLGLRHAQLLVGEHFPQLDDSLAQADDVLLLFPAEDGALPWKAGERTPLNTRMGSAREAGSMHAAVHEPVHAAVQASVHGSIHEPARESEHKPADEPAHRRPSGSDETRLLVVPDGTWRKARQIVKANPALSSMPRLCLPPAEPSEYKVRKATEPGALSTIEAIARALAIFEPDQDFQPLLQPFRALVQQQINAMGPEVYQRNHAKSDAQCASART